MLRHELKILRRQVSRPQLLPADRALLAGLPACCRRSAGASCWSRRRRFCAGIASSSPARPDDALAREARKLAVWIGEQKRPVQDRSRAMGRRLRAIMRTIRRRSGQAKGEVLKLTAQAGELGAFGQGDQAAGEDGALESAWAERAGEAQGGREARGARRSMREDRRADQTSGNRGADRRPADLALRPGCAAYPQGQARQAERVRVRDRARGGDREHQAWGARVDPARGDSTGHPGENVLLLQAVQELKRLELSPREWRSTAGSCPGRRTAA